MAFNPADLERFLGQAVTDMGAAMSACLVMIGDRLGLYRAMADGGPMTPADLAKRSGCAERYLREWLLNQAAGGYVDYDARTGKYALNEVQRVTLADEESPFFVCGAFDIIQSMHRDEPKIRAAFRSGEGVPWGEHDACLFCGTARFFGPNYRGNLIGAWIPALQGVQEKLARGGSIADVGCGHGISTRLLAEAFPQCEVVGFDAHAPSIECARREAEKLELSNLRFEVADATRIPAAQDGSGFDLIACFDCLHDMGDPVGCAKSVKQRLKKDGTWMVVEPFAHDEIEKNLNPVGRTFSAASTMICVPASLASKGPALGAQAGPKKLQETMKAGGFSATRVAATTPFNLVLEARL